MLSTLHESYLAQDIFESTSSANAGTLTLQGYSQVPVQCERVTPGNAWHAKTPVEVPGARTCIPPALPDTHQSKQTKRNQTSTVRKREEDDFDQRVDMFVDIIYAI